MKQSIIVAALIMVASTVFAADTTAPSGQNFQLAKDEAEKRINARIGRAQQELACVQAAKTVADINVCSDKFQEGVRGQQEQNRTQREERRERMRQERQQ